MELHDNSNIYYPRTVAKSMFFHVGRTNHTKIGIKYTPKMILHYQNKIQDGFVGKYQIGFREFVDKCQEHNAERWGILFSSPNIQIPRMRVSQGQCEEHKEQDNQTAPCPAGAWRTYPHNTTEPEAPKSSHLACPACPAPAGLAASGYLRPIVCFAEVKSVCWSCSVGKPHCES
jgi:hypothetical protein